VTEGVTRATTGVAATEPVAIVFSSVLTFVAGVFFYEDCRGGAQSA